MRNLALTLLLAGAACPAFAQDPGPDAPPAPPAAPEAPTPPKAPDLERYTEASLLLHREAYAEALAAFERLLSKHPDTRLAPEAHYWRARCLEQLDRPSEAKAAYEALLKRYAKSGWAADARDSLQRLRSSAARSLTCQVLLAGEQQPFEARLRGLNHEGVLLSGGPYERPTRVPLAKVQHLTVAGEGSPRVLFLRNGDRISGRLRSTSSEALVLEAPQLAQPLQVPSTRILELQDEAVAPVTTGIYGLPGRGGKWTLSTAPLAPIAPAPPAPVLPAPRPPEQEEREVIVRKNADGSTTTIETRPDGTRIETTVSADGKQRQVQVQRTSKAPPERGKQRIELRLQGEGGEQEEELHLDLDLEEGELREALKDLPERVRRHLHESLMRDHSRQGKRAKRAKRIELRKARKSGPAQVWVQGEGSKETETRVFVLREGESEAPRVWVERGEGPHKEKRVLVLERKGEGKHVFVEGAGPKQKRVVVVKKVRPGEQEEEHVFLVEPGQRESHEGHDFVWKGDRTTAFRMHALPTPPRAVHGLHFVQAESRHDRVFLRNGDRLTGRVTSMNGQHVNLKTSYGQVQIRRREVRQILFGTPPKAFLGVSLQASEGPGAVISEVFPNTPAAKAGLQAKDRIVAVGDALVRSSSDLHRLLEGRAVGDRVQLKVHRGDDRLALVVVLGEAPSQARHVEELHEHLQREGGSPDYRRALQDYRRALRLDPGKNQLRRAQTEAERARKEALERAAKARRSAKREAEGARKRALEKARRAREEALRQRRRAADERKQAEEQRKRAQEQGRSGRPRLGVALESREGKVIVQSVRPNSAAARVGLEKGDHISRFQGEAITSTDQLIRLVAKTRPGQIVEMTVRRGDGILQLRFAMGAREASEEREQDANAPQAEPEERREF